MGECILHGNGGGGTALNFNVVGGTSAPSNPKQNTVWVNTNATITSWSFGADDPNFYNLSTRTEGDAHTIIAPHKVSAGDILNFKIPKVVLATREAICIRCPETNKSYYVRQAAGTAVNAWSVGTMVGVELSNTSIPIGSYGSDSGTAYLRTWGKYYHKEGTAWFQTSSASTGSFNALKKNGVMVYPVSTKQYISGAWVNKTAKTYQNGAWKDWTLYLYREGDTFNALTGGYITTLLSGDYGAPTVEFQANRIYVNTTGTSQPMVRTRNKIDLSSISTLTLSVDGLTCASSESYIWFYVTANEITSKNPTVSDGAIVKTLLDADTLSATELTIPLNVSSINTSMYVYVMGYSTFRLGVNTFSIKEIRGEA